MWAQRAPWVAAAAPDPPVVPGPDTPSSAHLTALDRPRERLGADERPADTPAPLDAAQTLYADPTSSLPWAERAIVVGRVAGSDVDGFFLFDQGEPARIQGRDGRVGRSGGLWFASWPIPTCDVCDQEAFVIGHGLSRARVLAIAESVRQAPTPAADPATLPTGLRAMGSLPGALGTVVTRPWGEQLKVRAGGTTAELTVWTGDPRLYAHLAFWGIDDHAIDGSGDWRKVVADGRRVVAIDAERRPSADEAGALEAAARALVPGDDDAVERALDEAASHLEPVAPTRNLCGPNEGRWATLSGIVDRAVWAVTLRITDQGGLEACDTLITIDGGESSGALYTRLEPVPRGGVRALPSGGNTPGGQQFLRVDGDVPATAARVVVDVDGEAVDAVLADTGPEPGRRWFSIAVSTSTLTPRVTVTAYDTDGAAIANADVPT
jgi:hypothetical protein